MAEKSNILSPENLSTITAVTFVLALVSLAFNFYTFSRLNQVAAVLGGVDAGLNQKNKNAFSEVEKRIAALEAQVKAQAAAKAAAPAPAAGAEGGATAGGK